MLAGDGASFCAGADVEWMRASVELVRRRERRRCERDAADVRGDRCVPGARRRARAGPRARRRRWTRRCADIAIAEAETVFAFSEVKLGIIPAVISPFALAKIGAGSARRYFLTGERFDAATALRIGLVSEVTDQLDDAVERVVAELLSAGPHAARWAKRLVRERPDGPETARWIAERRASDEGRRVCRRFSRSAPRSGGVYLPTPLHPPLRSRATADLEPAPARSRRLRASRGRGPASGRGPGTP